MVSEAEHVLFKAVLMFRCIAEEPREAPKRSVDMFLDLAATEEDHQQVSRLSFWLSA
jgi:hypothetical protein